MWKLAKQMIQTGFQTSAPACRFLAVKPDVGMAIPRLTLENVIRKELDGTLSEWLGALTRSWSSTLVNTPPNDRAAFAFTHIDDLKIRDSLRTLYRTGHGQNIGEIDWDTLRILLNVYVRGMHRRADHMVSLVILF